MRDNRSIANALVAELLAHGYIVHRYNASSGSIYLKLDYGAAHSIRIADHPSNKGLAFRWNIGDWIVAYHQDRGTYWQDYFPGGQQQELINAIDAEHSRLIQNFGIEAYQQRVKQGKHEAYSAVKGFWIHPATYQCSQKRL